MLPRLLITLIAGAAALLPPHAFADAQRPVVVELFTSEGCSSCPPADRLLSELSDTRTDVLPLAFHVTYWNQLGWKDPFSFAGADARQARYAQQFRGFEYTPEMVVDGKAELVGSDRSAAGTAIEHARSDGVTAATVRATRANGGVSVSIGPGVGRAHVLLIGYDARHVTAVGRGENAGRMLTESNVVRSIVDIGEWSGAALTLHADAVAGEHHVILLEADDGAIVGAASVIQPGEAAAR
ncbi:DUF1223 domain-containing protein [Paraburkholderia phymatum]|uniref:DUF1223 domain-containing protein n=1 Tax=Paraburkholderia phymatum (strain DSM 17167 / CIP 108236 / LMG 21445 / STM815) TaxID=391038 RepID=B2JLA8_PARP8|nr:DUF1223 domain-containing protein [Paraburkholderia phymatum]ACC74076.1 protein of unknown function DUF1223 [Paraburkholderia phymatum STM815]